MIFIPKKINICFNKQDNALCDKLGFVTYFDEQNKMRKSKTWNEWGDKNIPNLLTENNPISGFVLDNAIGGIHSWSDRIAWCRVCDPRGFEIEITIPNLLWILESTACEKRILKGKFVYAWGNMGDLLLISTQCKEYDSLVAESNKLFARKPFSTKELIEGHVYKTRGGTQLLYMGRSYKWEIKANYTIRDGYFMREKLKDLRIIQDRTDKFPIKDKLNPDDGLYPEMDYRYQQVHDNKRYFYFYEVDNQSDFQPYKNRIIRRYHSGAMYESECGLKILNSVSGRFVEDLGEHKCYKKYIDKLNHEKEFVPIDFSKSTIHKLSFKDFKHMIEKCGLLSYLTLNNNGALTHVYFKELCVNHCFKYYVNGTIYDLKGLYDYLNPYYGIYYLENGNIYGYVGKRD